MHLIGLVSDGGVHSSDRHLKALIELAAEWGVEDLVVHAFTDGRDTLAHTAARRTSPRSRAGWTRSARAGSARVIGRYFAMDRDKRWDRMQKAYDLLVHGKAEHRGRQRRGGRAGGLRARRDGRVHRRRRRSARRRGIRPGDAVLAFNFRPDRMREITLALCDPEFSEIDRGGADVIDRYVDARRVRRGAGTYPVVFPPERPALTLAQVIAREGKGQLHVAETEKYPHVTYFFNGGEEQPYEGEVRELVPSPRDVPTYDHKPEMSAREAADAFVEHFEAEKPAFAIINFANPDMVGHTGVIEAAVKAVETVDGCLGRVVEAVHAAGRRLPGHRRPRQLRPHAQRRRLGQHGPLAEPGAVHRHRRCAAPARRRGHPCRRRSRRRSRCSGSSSRRR